MGRAPRRRIDRAPTRTKLIGIPVLSVMLASLSALLPMVATFPILPPFGFMMLIAWRLLNRTLWPVWAAVPLGLFDDMFSGQPIGSAMLLWTLAFFTLDLFDRRMIWRDLWQDWGLASLLIAVLLFSSLLIANGTGGTVAPVVLIPQIILSILLFPAVAKVSAALNRVRLSA
jgi:rod shape-determining protein MreD